MNKAHVNTGMIPGTAIIVSPSGERMSLTTDQMRLLQQDIGVWLNRQAVDLHLATHAALSKG